MIMHYYDFNVIKHKSFQTGTMSWYYEHDNEFSVLYIPPQPPDLNSTEHILEVV